MAEHPHMGALPLPAQPTLWAEVHGHDRVPLVCLWFQNVSTQNKDLARHEQSRGMCCS